MWKDIIILLIAVITGSVSLFLTLNEWDDSNYVHPSAGSYSMLAVVIFVCFIAVTVIILVIGKLSKQTISESVEDVLYQLWVAIIFAQSCHVWVTAISNQRIINACGNILTVGAPVEMNQTCLDRCDGTHVIENHRLPFLTQDATFVDASPECSPWFTEDKHVVEFVMTSETIVFVGFATHILTLVVAALTDRQKVKCSPLLTVDIIACLSVACITVVPNGYYSAYNIGGAFRFLGLVHFIAPLHNKLKTPQLVGFLIVLKLMFVTLTGAAIMFVAEKPCLAIQENCDSGFDNFGNTVYFIFVTLSTVGYGDMSPKTVMGKVAIVFIIMGSISYLPNIISEILEMCRKNPIHDRLDDMHADIKQVGFHMNGGTLKHSQRRQQSRLLQAIRRNGKSNH
tara:strand:+ start:676 stop:1866 length:1191 start_codon:yes stop_codon:yes gene_type:complete